MMVMEIMMVMLVVMMVMVIVITIFFSRMMDKDKDMKISFGDYRQSV